MKFVSAVVRPILAVLCCGLLSMPLSAGQLTAVHHAGLSVSYGKPLGFSAVQASGLLRAQDRGISRDAAGARVKRQFGGKILAISQEQRNGRVVYRVKGLSDQSQVYVVYVDKQSGRISR